MTGGPPGGRLRRPWGHRRCSGGGSPPPAGEPRRPDGRRRPRRGARPSEAQAEPYGLAFPSLLVLVAPAQPADRVKRLSLTGSRGTRLARPWRRVAAGKGHPAVG